jgi:hypothetical protein
VLLFSHATPLESGNSATNSNPSTIDTPSTVNAKAWDIVRRFAADKISLPVAEEELEKHFGSRFNAADWKPAFDTVFLTEKDTAAAIAAVDELSTAAKNGPGLTTSNSSPSESSPAPPMLAETAEFKQAEQDLLKAVDALAQRRRILGTPPTLTDLLDPPEEEDVNERQYSFKDDNAIVAEARRQLAEEAGDVIDIDDDSDDDDDESPPLINNRSGIECCQDLERLCMGRTKASTKEMDDDLKLVSLLRKLRVRLNQEEIRNSKQSELTDFFTKK